MITIAGGIILAVFLLALIPLALVAVGGTVIGAVRIFRYVLEVFWLTLEVTIIRTCNAAIEALVLLKLTRRVPRVRVKGVNWTPDKFDAKVPHPEPIYFPRVEADGTTEPMSGLKSVYDRRSNCSWYVRK